jgi:hypothetical protein
LEQREKVLEQGAKCSLVKATFGRLSSHLISLGTDSILTYLSALDELEKAVAERQKVMLVHVNIVSNGHPGVGRSIAPAAVSADRCAC